MLDRWFLAHPRSVDESYLAHRGDLVLQVKDFILARRRGGRRRFRSARGTCAESGKRIRHLLVWAPWVLAAKGREHLHGALEHLHILPRDLLEILVAQLAS